MKGPAAEGRGSGPGPEAARSDAPAAATRALGPALQAAFARPTPKIASGLMYRVGLLLTAAFVVLLPLAYLGLIAFVDLQILVVAATSVWALVGYFHLPFLISAVLAVLVGVPALWACWKVARIAVDAERRGGEEPIEE